MGSGFGEPGGTPLPRTLRGTLPGLLVTGQLHSGWFGWAGWARLLWALWRIAWQNSRHLATPALVSTRNDVWETSAEIPYWWRVSTQIWVVKPLIESTTRQICLTNQTHDPDPGSDTSSVWNFYARLSDVIIGVANVGCFLRLGKGFLAKRTTSVSLHFSRSLRSMAVLSSRVSSPPFIT